MSKATITIAAASVAAALALGAGCSKAEPPLPVPGPIAGDPIDLSYRLRAGETWRFDVEAVQRMGDAGDGGPTMTLRYTLALRVVDADPAGGGRVAIGFEDLTMKSEPAMPATGGQLDFTGVDITAVLSPAGAVDDLQVVAPAGRDPEMYRTIVVYALMPFRMADAPVRVNEPWSTDSVIPTRLMGLAQALDFHARMQSWITRVDGDRAEVQVVGEVELARQTVTPEAGTIGSGPVEVASAGRVTMTVVFDRARGMVSALAGDMRSKMDIVTGDDRVVVRAGATTKMQLRPVVGAADAAGGAAVAGR